MTKYLNEVEVEQNFTRTRTMRVVAANEDDLNDKIEERTKCDAVRIGCGNDYDGRVLFIMQTEELPTAKKY